MKPDRSPVTKLEEILDDLAGAVVCTMLHLYTRYRQARISKAYKKMTIFTCRYGKYKFVVMPFRLMNSVTTFQRMMDGVLREVQFVMVYIDDVFIFSKSIEEHLEHCRQVFEKIGQAGLTFRVSNCSFVHPETTLLGHFVNPGGVQVDIEKIEDILGAPAPTKVTHWRSFLGLAGYYRQLIRNFAECSAVLHATTLNKKKFE